ncbi:ZINC KNUCKLE (CCHC-TYPE) FAMILY PROTEIN [Salix koriyanagi]|uniref:ZINC KNUCKLE (CCHC-TYPE) FAMILY PROTEIN n=1 Tax=Salix koriyanagi TaxID=2511006 RepID=A0A9Q0WQT8_9ROSI|nr:ZINC KNUCKLE (CCHC-TYPE) FAMILY PROTEIN [Salix koriyanagi]
MPTFCSLGVGLGTMIPASAALLLSFPAPPPPPPHHHHHRTITAHCPNKHLLSWVMILQWTYLESRLIQSQGMIYPPNHLNQGLGLVQMVSISESFLAQVVEEEGYTPCSECGIDRFRLDCSLCNGKGMMTCRQCLGDCVIWEESIDEQPWEKARSISPFKVKEDDEVDNLEIKLVKKKSKRVYQSLSPEVGMKISQSLKSLNAKTGLFSKRMKMIHRDPMLHAQRVAAIKKAKGTAAARKRASETLKAFFSDPENRKKRSIAMKGVKFYCSNCGREGHRKHYCPELKDSSVDRRFKCRLCGKKGHNRRTCPKSRMSNQKGKVTWHHRCRICRQRGHNRRSCPQGIGIKLGGGDTFKDFYCFWKQKIHVSIVSRKGPQCEDMS